MSWLASKLNKRLQIGEPVQTENDAGGFDFSFNSILSVWCWIEPFAYISGIARYLRGVQLTENTTHVFGVRKTALNCFGKAFTSGFTTGFDSISDIRPLKNNYFLFLQVSSSSHGRLFQIEGLTDYQERGEYYLIAAQEVEEQGTGMNL